MRQRVLCTLIWLGFAQVVAADGAMAAATAPMFPGGDPASQRAGPRATASPSGLDLRVDPGLLPSAQVLSDGALAIEGGWADRATEQRPDGALGIEGSRADGDTAQGPADRGLSFGLELKPRSRMGALARQHDHADDPSLGGQLERLIEQPVFGVRGRYRF